MRICIPHGKQLLPALSLVVFLGQLCGAQDDRYRLHFASPDPTAATAEVFVLLDSVDGSNGPATSVQTLNLGICIVSAATLSDVELGSAVAEIRNGFPAAAFNVTIEPSRLHLGVVTDFLGNDIIPPGTDSQIARLSYSQTAGSTLDLEWCNTPPNDGAIHVVEGSSMPTVRPVLDNDIAVVGALPENFIRGDCDTSGSVGISDVISFLIATFNPPGLAVSYRCQDACDADDSGDHGILDAFAMLNFSFGQPSTPLPAPTTCGTDPTADTLDCDAPLFCP